MGIDNAGCNNVILYGPPKTHVDLIQEIGRVGRDGSQSLAVLMYNSFHLRNCDADIKSMLVGSNCRRETLMEQFLSKNELKSIEKGIHMCCDICVAACKCSKCDKLEFQKLISELVITEEDSEVSNSTTISYVYESDSPIPDEIFNEF